LDDQRGIIKRAKFVFLLRLLLQSDEARQRVQRALIDGPAPFCASRKSGRVHCLR
jgi:hypothetical protein